MRRQSLPHAKGFSLIEILVAVVILAVALLGTAGLTAASLKSTNTSYYRSQATVLADDIMDRMRANITQARGGQYNIAAGPAIIASVGSITRFDCEEWTDTVAQTLPQGVGIVTVADGVATVVIRWDNGDSSFTTVSRL